MIKAQTQSGHEPNIAIRTYREQDKPTVRRLYTQGLLHGQIAPNDTGADLGSIREEYLSDPANHFWVAEADQNVVGMIGVVKDGHTAEIRRLRVDPKFQSTNVGLKLVETALAHCKTNGLLKIVLDTHFEKGVFADLFTKFGFQHTRTKTFHGKDILEFYLDLYRSTKPFETGVAG
jgi:N-acetylglutamate synthase-like GNAT family acetyltransferase